MSYKIDNLFGKSDLLDKHSLGKPPKGKEKTKSKKQNRKERKKYARRTLRLVVGYLSVVFIIIFLCGYKCMVLSDTILIALVVTSFAQVIGLFAFVMKYLFYTKKPDKK